MTQSHQRSILKIQNHLRLPFRPLSSYFCLDIYILSRDPVPLKGPKREIFAGIFAQIRPIWIGYLGIRPKNPKKLCLRP
jgi:hypothetical protein